MVKELQLTQGQVALVDDEDYEDLSRHKWLAQRMHHVKREDCFYAKRFVCPGGKKTAIYMHRVIMDAPKNKMVDHINSNPLDNTRANLRFATYSENHQNRARIRGTSQYKGVSWDVAGKWRAQITLNYKVKYLGLYTDEKEAARVYDAEAIKRFGQFARPNFPTNKETK